MMIQNFVTINNQTKVEPEKLICACVVLGLGGQSKGSKIHKILDNSKIFMLPISKP